MNWNPILWGLPYRKEDYEDPMIKIGGIMVYLFPIILGIRLTIIYGINGLIAYVPMVTLALFVFGVIIFAYLGFKVTSPDYKKN